MPIESIATSSGPPLRPSTKLWWYTSLMAYAKAIPAGVGPYWCRPHVELATPGGLPGAVVQLL